MTNPADDICIVGIGESEYRTWGGIKDRSELQLACEVVKKAADDAGLEVDRIDGLSSYSNDANEPAMLQESLGLPDARFMSGVWGSAGAGACGAVLHAALAVKTGLANYVMVLRALCQGQGRRYGRFNPARPGNNFLAPFGMFAPPILLAPLAQRYMSVYGIRQEALGHVAITCRENGARNPRAVKRDQPLTMESYLASRTVASPLLLPDCCQENDGACGFIVTTMERARDLKQKPVRILSAAQGTTPYWGQGALANHNMPVDDYGSGNGGYVAKQVYERAGLGPNDIDVAQFYDHFSPFVLMSLENFGFCGRGEAGDFVTDGNVRWQGGSLPINTHGGHLAEAYIHGLNHVLEGVRQMRGQSTSQVRDARTCLVTAGLGASATSAAILGV